MYNCAHLLGRVGKKDVKAIKNGGNLTVLSLATTDRFKDSTGQPVEITTWHHISCFSKLGEVVNQYVQVGDIIFVQGKIQNKKIEQGNRAGQFFYSIHANDVKFIPKNSGQTPSTSASKSAYGDSTPEFDDSEIPF